MLDTAVHLKYKDTEMLKVKGWEKHTMETLTNRKLVKPYKYQIQLKMGKGNKISIESIH